MHASTVLLPTPASIPHPRDTLPLQPVTHTPLDELLQHHLATQMPRSQPNNLVFAHSFLSNAARISSPCNARSGRGGLAPPPHPSSFPQGFIKHGAKLDWSTLTTPEQPPAGQAGEGQQPGSAHPCCGAGCCGTRSRSVPSLCTGRVEACRVCMGIAGASRERQGAALDTQFWGAARGGRRPARDVEVAFLCIPAH